MDDEVATISAARPIASIVVEGDDERPEIGDIARQLRRPASVASRPRPSCFGVLNAVRMSAQEQTARTNIEDVGLGTSIERLRQQRMRDGNQRDVGLLGYCQTKAKGTVRREIGDQTV
jgi:hypothetical protein